MNSQSQENTPPFELPDPAPSEKTTSPETDQLDMPVTEAQATAAVERGISSGQAARAASLAAQQQMGAPAAPPPVAAAAQGQAPSGTSAGWMPQIAEDTDLIEKSWVDKAKEILAQTSHDPYLQNKEMTKVRADYMKKRYNKDLKLNEEE